MQGRCASLGITASHSDALGYTPTRYKSITQSMKRKCQRRPMSEVRKKSCARSSVLLSTNGTALWCCTVARRKDAERTRGGEAADRGVLTAAMMAYIGSGRFRINREQMQQQFCVSFP